MSGLLTATHLAGIMGIRVDALADIAGLPPMVEITAENGEIIAGYDAGAVMAWGDELDRASSTVDARDLISLQDAANLIGVEIGDITQFCTVGFPRHDPQFPRAVWAFGQRVGFIAQEIHRFQASRTVMAAQAGGVH